MKFVLPLVLAATLPLAAQMSDPLQPAFSTPSTNDAPTNAPAAAPSAPDNSTPGMNPAVESEPVVQAPPLNTNAAAAPADQPPVIQAPAILSQPSVPDTVSTSGMPPTLSSDPFSDPLIAQIVGRYQKAWDGDRKEAKALTTDLERWMKDEPNNYLLLAYRGSVYALDSRDAWIGPGKLSYLKKADTDLDTAVSSDPSNPAIRLLRAMNYYELPAIFQKHAAAHADFAYLLEQVKGTLPMPYKLKTETLQAIYYYAGLSDVQFSQQNEARAVWQTGLALDPSSALGQKIQTELNKLK